MTEQPLSGMTFLVTRPREQAESLQQKLTELGGTVVSCPMIEIGPPADEGPLLAAARTVQEFDWIILTSVNGVSAFAAALQKVGGARDTLPLLPHIAAIGPATAEACERYGFPVALIPPSYVAESIYETLRQREPSLDGVRILLPRAETARRNLSELLKQAGARVTDIVAYATKEIDEFPTACRELIGSDKSFHVIFTSSSTVNAFFSALEKQFPRRDRRSILAISIGPITSATLREHGIQPCIQAEEFSVPGLVREIVARITRRGPCANS